MRPLIVSPIFLVLAWTTETFAANAPNSSFPSIWPQPFSVDIGNASLGTGPVKLSPKFDIHLGNHQNEAANVPDLMAAMQRTMARLQHAPPPSENKTDDEWKQEAGNATELTALSLYLVEGREMRDISVEAHSWSLDPNTDQYWLTVTASGDGSGSYITAETSLGLLRGLQTFEQLWRNVSAIDALYAPSTVYIWDKPAFVSSLSRCSIVIHCIDTVTPETSWAHARYWKEFVRYRPHYDLTVL